MKFGPVPVAEAEGAINAHSVAVENGRIAKGKFIDSDDIAALMASGIESIIVARLGENDVHEDEAALEIASALSGARVETAPAFTGRVNLFANCDGVLSLDASLIHGVNQIHECITLATLMPGTRVSTGTMIATIKIIPFSVERALLEQVLDLLSGSENSMSIAPFVAHKVGLVATRVSGTPEKMLDKTARLLTSRVEQLGSELGEEIRCDHTETSISEAITKLIGQGHEPVIVFGASATVDRRDMVPLGIEAAGGVVDHFGMPVDPGNLLLLGHLGEGRIVGAPGCARSPAENGFDRVLEQMMARQSVTPQTMVALGAGGLYKEIYSRPHPRRAVASHDGDANHNFAVVILAAGQSRRMGNINKLLQEIDGKAMLRHVAEAACASEASMVLVVTGHEHEQTEAVLKGLDVSFVHNPDYSDGLSSSLKTGVAGLNEDIDGFLVCLGDMPGISKNLLDQMMAAYAPEKGRLIIAPVFQEKRGNPVLFGSRFRPAIADLDGDMGAKFLIGRNEDVVFEIQADENILLDVDTPDALKSVRDRSS